MSHPWITQHSHHSDESIGAEAFTDMSATLNEIKVRKAALLYLGQRMQPQSFAELQKQCLQRDGKQRGHLPTVQFAEACQAAGMPIV